MYKLLANSLYGRTILNDRKYNTNTRLYHRADLNRPLSDPKFRKLRMVSSDCYSVTKNKSHIMLKSPIYIGAMILQKAKLQNFRFHYKVVKPSAANFPKEHIICDEKDKDIIMKSRQYIESINMVYSDMDSLCYEVTMKVVGKHADFSFL